MSNLPTIRSKEIKEFYEQLEKEIDKQMGEVRGIFDERRKSMHNEMLEIISEELKYMTVADLKKTISKMPDDAVVMADDSEIKKITATLNKDGDIIAVNIEI